MLSSKSFLTPANTNGMPEIPQVLLCFKNFKKKFISTCLVLSRNKDEEDIGGKIHFKQDI